MEFENILQELLCDDKSEDADFYTNYCDIIASNQHKSLLSFHDVQILPPILSEADKQAMREYRRKAVKLEQKNFEARRQKYSNFILQVMELGDRFQASESKENNLEKAKPIHRQPSATTDKLSTTSSTYKNKSVDEPSNIYSTKIKDTTIEPKTAQKNTESFHDDENLAATIFQKPKIHHSLSSPNKDKSRNVISSIQSDVPSEMSINESVRTLTSSVLGRESMGSTTSTLKASQQSSIREALDYGQGLNPCDSLASTVLSMAFTDSSISSQLSMNGVTDQPTKSAQRQLNMDKANHNLYQSYHQKVNPPTSTPVEPHRKQLSNKPINKAVAAGRTSSDSKKTYTKTDYEQDRALEKLEIMKKKLLEEKEKHMVQLRQQELTRLRKSKERPQSAPLGHHSQGAADMYSQGHISSRPNSDMYSIPERSFEGTSSFRHGEYNEVESASDKENNIYREDHDHYNAYQTHYNDEEIDESNIYRDDLEERFSEDIDHRPFSALSMQNIGNQDRRRSSLYVRKSFEKQFEIEISKGSTGKDKFSILSAYAKGFMTRHLLQTEKVQAIVKTIKDTSEFLADISKEGTTSYQDKNLQQRVHAQLVAAKTKLYDIFFTIPTEERMTYIAHSRNAAREKEDRMYAKRTESKQLTRKISAATMKAMQRRQGETTSTSSVVKKSSPPRPASQFGKRRSMDTRALRPVQSTKSPQGVGRLQAKRRSLASPLARRSIGKKITNSRPSTAPGARIPANRKSIGRSSIEADKSVRQSRPSLDNGLLSSKRIKTNMNTDSDTSKLPVKRSTSGSSTYRIPEGLSKVVARSRPSTATTAHDVSQAQKADNRPKTGVGVRRVTRSMAAQFKK